MEDFHDDSFTPNVTGGFRDESERRLYEALRKNPNLDYDPEEDELTEEQFEAMLERKRRIAERREAGRNKRAQEAALRAAKASGTKKVPAATKPVKKKKTDLERNREEQIMKPVSKEEEAKQKARAGRKLFYICLGIYALVLMILGFIFLRYTDKCLRRYEDTRYENVIGDIVKQFSLKVKDGSIMEMVSIPEHACVFESEDLYRTTYLNILRSSDSFSYEKDKKSYDTSHPVYDLFGADGNLVAKIKLKAVNEKTIFAILRVGDWVIESVTPSLSVTTNSYRISVPDNYNITVNGIAVTDEFMVGDPVPVEVKLADDVMSHVHIPSMVTYEIEGLAEKPVILIYNSMGEEMAFTPDEKGNIRLEAQVGVRTEMPADRREFALDTAQKWTDFLTRDLPGANYGLATIQKRLIKDSYYYKEAQHYASDVDITFISDHRDGKPKYTDVSVTDYTEYSDECYSCRIVFTKNMILNRTGQSRTVTVDTTNYYVYVDDSDDGVINPHWCVADMIQTTKTTESEE